MHDMCRVEAPSRSLLPRVRKLEELEELPRRMATAQCRFPTFTKGRRSPPGDFLFPIGESGSLGSRFWQR